VSQSQSRLGKPDPELEGVELFFHLKGGRTSFGAKVVLSFNGVDLSCINSITGSTCRAKCSNILNDSTTHRDSWEVLDLLRVPVEVDWSPVDNDVELVAPLSVERTKTDLIRQE
jgi:hypothetical protein